MLLRATVRVGAAMLGVVALLAVASSPAWATAQVEEELVLDGLVHRMQSTPLEPYLDALPKRPDWLVAGSSALWRGYIGTWTLRGDRLHLLKLRRWSMGLRDDAGEDGKDPTIPLSRLFGEREAPIPATWFSGVLRIAQGQQLQYVHMGFGTLYERTLRIEVREGRVVSRRVVDNLRETVVRSRKDMQWVSITSTPPPDDGRWHDARSLRDPGFLERVPVGEAFETRGVLVGGEEKGGFSLWIPEATLTPEVYITLRGAKPIDAALGHVEIRGVWREGEAGRILTVTSQRRLKPGETIHHPKFVVPDLEARLAKLRAEFEENERVSLLQESFEAGWAYGTMVQLLGELSRGEVATVLGVEVDPGEVPAGKRVMVEGRVEKWVITPHLIAATKDAPRWFTKRGPGVYFRLVRPGTDELARAERS